jgi:hypothetical protein
VDVELFVANWHVRKFFEKDLALRRASDPEGDQKHVKEDLNYLLFGE